MLIHSNIKSKRDRKKRCRLVVMLLVDPANVSVKFTANTEQHQSPSHVLKRFEPP